MALDGNPVSPVALAALATLTNLRDKDFEIPATADIPDTGLAAAVRDALGLARNVPILLTQLETLTELYAYGRGITDLTGLEGATGLTWLDLRDNSIDDITDLSNLTNLTELYLADNSIDDITDLSNLTNLTELYLADNSIDDITDLSGLTNLTELYLADNSISDVSPLANLTNLETLDLTGNTGITNAAVLFRLKQGGTEITGVTVPDSVFFPDTTLETAVRSALNLQTNQPILPSSFAALTTLTASNLGIVDLAGIEHATGLTSLTLSNNQITDVSPLRGLTNLTTLDLTGNTGITNLAVLFSLQAGGTTITGVSVPASVVFSDTALAGAVRSALRLASDASIPSDDLAALRTLSGLNRGIADLTGLENAVSLTSLTLRDNQIMDVSMLSSLTQLTTLDLRNNQIIDVLPLAALMNLRTLNLTGNAVSNPEALIPLQTGGTQITGITLPHEVIFPDAGLAEAVRTALSLEAGMPVLSNRLAALTSLNAGSKGITDLAGLEGATGLTWVNLGSNSISDISPLENLTNLATLDLWGDRISDVSPLENLTSLTWLRLSYNLVTDVSPLADMTHLKWIYLAGNPVANSEALFILKQRGGTLIDIYVPSVVAIPDTALAGAVRTALGLVTDAPLLPDALASLRTLEAPSLGIVHLTGLEVATGLTRLTLNDNQIRSVSPLAYLANLQTLNLSDNQIKDVSPLAGLTSLKTLDITNNPVENAGVLLRLKQARTRITGTTIPNTVVFRDDDLEIAMRAVLNLADTQPILPDALATLTRLDITRLDVPRLKINDLRGIEIMTNLEHLNLSDQEITDVLPLAALTGLTRLALDGNPVENPEVLFRLKQAGTRITGVVVPDSVVFVDMALESAVRSALRLSAHYPASAEVMQTLTRLTATRKGISDLTGLEEATGLETLDLGDNEITDISLLSNLTNLENLDLADNEITDISVLSGLSRLETLDLRNNDVMDVMPLVGLTDLTQLYLRGNENLTTGLKQLVPLTNLRVDIDLPEPVMFLSTDLQTAVRNELNGLPGFNLQPSDEIFPEDVAQLTQLTASSSSIDDLTGLEYAVGLTRLTLSNNAIVDVSPLSGLTSLTNLNLRSNQIIDVLPLASLTNLTDLDLTDNVGITNPEVLYRLKAGGTRITGVTVPDAVAFGDANLETTVRLALRLAAHLPILPTNMQTLTTLTVSRKGVTDLTGLQEATGLTRLTLSNNAIVDVSPMSGLTSLAQLYLQNNQITDVLPLAGLTNLTTLVLTGNPVSNPGVLYRLKQGGTRITGVTIPDAVVFTDTALETAVRSALNLQATEPILPDELAALTTLSASGRGIVDLTGLEHATGLTNLTLSNNQIIDVLPLVGLTSLTQLHLANNPITNPGVLYPLQEGGTTITGVTIPSAVVFTDTALDTAVRSALRIAAGDTIFPDALAALTRLTTARKGINDLSGLEHATGLERLDLGQNENVTNISALTYLIRLENLDLAGNQITAIFALSSLTRLEVLDLRNNDVTDTARLSEMTHLKNLYVRGNDNLSDLKQLVRLTDAGVRVDITLPKSVTFRDDNLASVLRRALSFQPDDPIFPEDMEGLTTFDGSNESIVNLTGLETATALTTLNLSGNEIVTLSPLSKLVALETLNLSENEIRSISSLSGLTSLTDLNLSDNQISSVSSLSKLVALETLNLADNEISSLSSLSGLSALTDLNLSNNTKIKDVLPLQGLSSLTTLNLSGNTDITNAEVLYRLEQGGTNVTVPSSLMIPTNVVAFRNTALETAVRSALGVLKGYPVLPTGEEGLDTLTRLTATRKEIADLTGLEQATGLTTLDLGDNAIINLGPLQNLTSLTSLDLADNAIVDLSPLRNLTNLTSLDLDDNEIEDVSALSGLTSLQTLDLRDNDVRTYAK